MRPEEDDAAERSPSQTVNVLAFLAISIRKALARTFSVVTMWCWPIGLPERRHRQRWWRS